jgi:hypothetical protein
VAPNGPTRTTPLPAALLHCQRHYSSGSGSSGTTRCPSGAHYTVYYTVYYVYLYTVYRPRHHSLSNCTLAPRALYRSRPVIHVPQPARHSCTAAGPSFIRRTCRPRKRTGTGLGDRAHDGRDAGGAEGRGMQEHMGTEARSAARGAVLAGHGGPTWARQRHGGPTRACGRGLLLWVRVTWPCNGYESRGPATASGGIRHGTTP